MLAIVTPMTKRYGDRLVGQVGFLLLFAAYALIFFVRDLAWFFPVLILWAAGAAMIEPTLMTMLTDRAPKEERGAIMGMSDSVNSVALIVSPAIGTAVVGFDARLIGIIPALAAGGAWVIGRFRGRHIAEDVADAKPA